MSDVPGRLRARFHREAHEALVEAIALCERADRLRADVSRLVAVSIAADGHAPGDHEITDQVGTVEQLVDLVSEAAGLLGQATWFWAQTINHEASSDLTAWSGFGSARGLAAEEPDQFGGGVGPQGIGV